eukprot:TRINITY_DN11563_c0_g1_i4.p1 TRINITY_DN11563_c0_g1~~TRINITY_DN11563_c0_g1_i4.p1  ORF type:complete len:376 (-),score=63.77 TRINITY_DN11563_c0_g1_i4:61-1188(-)
MCIRDRYDPIKYDLFSNHEAFKCLTLNDDKKRSKLPFLKDPNEKINIWGTLKESLGKDLSKFSVPVYLNEPLSMLQRLCEQFEYSELLNKTVRIEDSCLRMAYVMAFAFSYYSSSINRIRKPFNPLLSETFEYINEDKKFRFFAEQVSHHPPISAAHCESETFTYYTSAHIKSTFWGKSLEFKPMTSSHIVLKRHNDHFAYNQPTTALQNILLGKLYVDHYGDMTFTNATTGDHGVLTMTKRGWNDRNAYEAEGYVKDSRGEIMYRLKGRWDKNLIAIHEDTKEETILWLRGEGIPDQDKQYFFTDYTLQLNYLNKELAKFVPCTDSRLRPDQRALELGDLKLAIEEKKRLEDKQRLRRKMMEEQDIMYLSLIHI